MKKNIKKFDYKGLNNQELVELCSDRNSFTGFADWKYWTAEVYSFGKHIRDYAFYSKFLPLYCYTDHGAGYFFNTIAKHEIENDAPVQLYHSPTNVKHYKEVSNKPCYNLFSPFVWYRRKHKIEKLENAKGTLSFPSHSTPDVDLGSDIENYIEELKNIPEEFQPVCVCLHMHDIHKGQHEIFLKHGIPVYTAGSAFDVRFSERFYDILKHFKYSTSNMAGSYTFYSVEMEIPFFIYGDTPVLINKSDKNLEEGEYKLNDSPGNQELLELFQGINKEITSAQKAYVYKHLGLNDYLSRFEMSKILHGAYFKRGNIFKDLGFAIKNYRKFIKKKIRGKL